MADDLTFEIRHDAAGITITPATGVWRMTIVLWGDRVMLAVSGAGSAVDQIAEREVASRLANLMLAAAESGR